MVGLDVIAQALLSGLFMGSVYALIAIGFTLVFGVTDIVNFAHGHLVMAAMFATYLLFKLAGIDPYLGLVLGCPYSSGSASSSTCSSSSGSWRRRTRPT
jgi:branched-chain amino acid transport system permease protein